jgi:16S rRNA (cytosine967-C5)-methyltransferase
MTPAARAAAAIEVLSDIDARRRPAADAMKDWGLAHRFAGSGDRAAISALVYDVLRKKSSSGWIMGGPSPRAEILGALMQTRGLDADAIAALFSGAGHAPAKLTEAEYARLQAADLSSAPAHVVGDFPQWLAPELEASFGASVADEGRALAERAPVDLRVNLLKTTRDKALAALAYLGPEPTPFSPI